MRRRKQFGSLDQVIIYLNLSQKTQIKYDLGA
jgi:hypothetical protein